MFGKYQFLYRRRRLSQPHHTSRDESISDVIFMHTTSQKSDCGEAASGAALYGDSVER